MRGSESAVRRSVCAHRFPRAVVIIEGASDGMAAPPLHDSRYRSLDVWRGLICILVVLEHTGVALWSGIAEASGVQRWIRQLIVTPLTWNLGAPLFFVISGYCVAASLESCRHRSSSAAKYLGRRFWRILPPYWASLAVLAMIVLALDLVGLERLHRGPYALEINSPGTLTAAQWWGNLSLTETWRPRILSGHCEVFTRVGWSLCYQEQFYLISVLVMVLAPRRFHGALAATTVGIIGVRLAAWDTGALYRMEGGFFDLWHEFAVGLAVYWRLNSATDRLTKRAIDLSLLLLLAVASYYSFTTTIGAATFGLILIAGRSWDAKVASRKSLEPLRALGRRSYSIYLVHLPAGMLMTAIVTEVGVTEFWTRASVTVPLSTAAAIAAGWLFHHAVDRHFHQVPASFSFARFFKGRTMKKPSLQAQTA
jgi:peptidoglycan/LPS O-acetylase OafA/YrhL